MSKYTATIRIGITDVWLKREIRGCRSKTEAWIKARRLYHCYPHLVLVAIRKKKPRR